MKIAKDVLVHIEYKITDEQSHLLNPDDDEEDSAVYVVTDIKDDVAVLDANHPFAGQSVTFEGQITQLQELSPQEVQEILEHDKRYYCFRQ